MQLDAFVHDEKEIICYGAGDYAFWIALFLQLRSIVVKGFIISGDVFGTKQYLNKPVYTCHTIPAEVLLNRKIIVAVQEKHHDVIQSNLQDIINEKYFITREELMQCIDWIVQQNMDVVQCSMDGLLSMNKGIKDIYKYLHCQRAEQFKTIFENYILCGNRYSQEYFKLYNDFFQNKLAGSSIYALGQIWKITNVISFLNQYKTILLDEVYKFPVDNSMHINILDFGANIGMSVKFYVENYPGANICAYEADPKIFEYLTNNVGGNYSNVHLYNFAVWDCETELNFYQEGCEGGHVTQKSNQQQNVIVHTLDSANIVQQYEKIDFLKIDIEGAETRVLCRIKPYLQRVQNIFVEYHSAAGETQTIADIFHILIEAGFRVHVESKLLTEKIFMKQATYNGFDGLVNIFGVRS